MKKLVTVLFLTALCTQTFAFTLKRKSDFSVKETIDRLQNAAKENQLNIFARINHQENAKKAGIETSPAEILIFGSPTLGNELLKENIRIGLELPIRAVAYEDEKGIVWLAYRSPMALANDYRIRRPDITRPLERLLQDLTKKASKQEIIRQ